MQFATVMILWKDIFSVLLWVPLNRCISHYSLNYTLSNPAYKNSKRTFIMLKKSHYHHNTSLCTSANGIADKAQRQSGSLSGTKKSTVRKETCQDWHLVILTHRFVWFYRIGWQNWKENDTRTEELIRLARNNKNDIHLN